MCSQRQAPPVLLLSTLEKGYNGALFYAHVKPVDDMMGEVYVAPPQYDGSVLAGATLLQHTRNVPPVALRLWSLDISYVEDKQNSG